MKDTYSKKVKVSQHFLRLRERCEKKWPFEENIAKGEPSQAIAPFHFFDKFHFFCSYDLILPDKVLWLGTVEQQWWNSNCEHQSLGFEGRLVRSCLHARQYFTHLSNKPNTSMGLDKYLTNMADIWLEVRQSAIKVLAMGIRCRGMLPITAGGGK